MIDSALESLHNYCKKEDYKGWDIFDGLKSWLFRSSPFYRSRLLRLAWIQFFKRSSVNFRRITLVSKDYNPKGLALFAAGLISLGKNDEVTGILERLKDMACSAYFGTCWGYNFDWQAKAFYVPVGMPNIVATVFVADAFLDCVEAESMVLREDGIEHRAKNKDINKQSLFEDYLKIAEGCCEFILHELVLFEDEKSLCFGYIPGEQVRVHNANMLGAALLARVYSLTGNSEYYEKSKKALAYSVAALNKDYSWSYGELAHHQFVDNFHTGYNLVALKEWMDYTRDKTWKEELKNAYKYFLDTFWLDNGCPKYYHNSLYPIDIHCSAQGIVTCLKLKDYDDRSVPMANKIAKWAIDNMQDESGYFYYQKTRWYTNKISYMRWSQAWMFYALAYLTSFQEISSQN
jgi:hypothetical protein